jgi:hypothetical protein
MLYLTLRVFIEAVDDQWLADRRQESRFSLGENMDSHSIYALRPLRSAEEPSVQSPLDNGSSVQVLPRAREHVMLSVHSAQYRNTRCPRSMAVQQQGSGNVSAWCRKEALRACRDIQKVLQAHLQQTYILQRGHLKKDVNHINTVLVLLTYISGDGSDFRKRCKIVRKEGPCRNLYHPEGSWRQKVNVPISAGIWLDTVNIWWWMFPTSDSSHQSITILMPSFELLTYWPSYHTSTLPFRRKPHHR